LFLGLGNGEKMISEEYKKVNCNNCESEYFLKYFFEKVTNEPQYCPFCGEEIEEDYEDDEDEEEEDNFEDDDRYN
jgi:NAD-dependent SIR2 family protein deacetylase